MSSITVRVTTKDEVVESSISIPDTVPPSEIAPLYAQTARSNGMIEAPEFDMDEDDPLGLRRGENN